MSFDHDLADEHYRNLMEFNPLGPGHHEMTGYDVALWMAEHGVWPTVECRVHSFNPVGARRIQGVVDRYGPYDKPCIWIPLDLASREVVQPDHSEGCLCGDCRAWHHWSMMVEAHQS